MIEKHIVLEDIDLVTFYGVNNIHLQMIKALYPKLRIVARGNIIKVMGDEEEMCSFEENIEKMQVHCARCMCEIEEIVEFKISEYLVREEDAAQVSEDDDAVIFSGEKIDIDELILNNFLMNVSGKYLCSEDCKGLCPNCGKNLNLGECDCSDNEIDPRWAALAEIMKNSETE